MEPMVFPDFMNEENMRSMSRQELVNLFLMVGKALFDQGNPVPDPLQLPVFGERMTVPVRDGEIRCIFYRAKRKHAPVYFEMHGGGFVGGNCEDVDFWCDILNRELDINIVNINYRKAPDYPWPVGANDAFDAVSWFYAHAAEFDLDTERMAIGGHSAGGNLSAVTCLRSVQENAPFRFKLQVLDYPPLDLSICAFDKLRHPMAIPPQMAMMFDACYIAPGQGNNPLISPAVADVSMLTEMPPAVVITAELDSLRDEAERFASKLIQAGVPVWSRRFIGSSHGFTMSLGGRNPLMPEDPNAPKACEMMKEALRYYLK